MVQTIAKQSFDNQTALQTYQSILTDLRSKLLNVKLAHKQTKLLPEYWNNQIQILERKITKIQFQVSLLLPKYRDKSNKQKLNVEQARQFPIEAIFAEAGIYPKIKTSERLSYVCPFHKDKDPSLVVFLKDNKAKCFGCNFYSDSIGIYMKLHNTNFRESVEKLM
jgi:hypothetical protein